MLQTRKPHNIPLLEPRPQNNKKTARTVKSLKERRRMKQRLRFVTCNNLNSPHLFSLLISLVAYFWWAKRINTRRMEAFEQIQRWQSYTH